MGACKLHLEEVFARHTRARARHATLPMKCHLSKQESTLKQQSTRSMWVLNHCLFVFGPQVFRSQLQDAVFVRRLQRERGAQSRLWWFFLFITAFCIY